MATFWTKAKNARGRSLRALSIKIRLFSGEVTYTMKNSRTEDVLPARPSYTSERRYSRDGLYDEVANGRHSHSHSQSRSRSLGDSRGSSSQCTVIEKETVTEIKPTTDFYSTRGRVRIDATPNIRGNPVIFIKCEGWERICISDCGSINSSLIRSYSWKKISIWKIPYNNSIFQNSLTVSQNYLHLQQQMATSSELW